MILKEQVKNAQNQLILHIAQQMGINCRPLILGNEDFMELTYGSRRVVINKTRSHKLPFMAGLLARNKEATNLLLRRQGLPVPDYWIVSSRSEEANRFLLKHCKVTVKPLDLNKSIGVTLGVQDEVELNAAIEIALHHSEFAMIQRHVEGFDYRVLVIDGEVAGVLEYRPAFVEGDGQNSIEELVRALNEMQLRFNVNGFVSSFQPIDITSGALHNQLAAQGYTLQSVAERGAYIHLFDSGNVEANAISEIITDRTGAISADNAQIAIEAAKALQVDVAGIDIRCLDIGSPLNEDNGGILEVNALPDMIDPYLIIQEATLDPVRRYLHYLFQ